MKLLRLLVLYPLFGLLAGCNAVVMHPAGDLAVQQRNLIIASTVLMLVIVVPVLGLTAFFGWRYRQSNTKATYAPDWHHSTQLELVIWSAPLIIIIALGALTWISTHLLDPYRTIGRIDGNKLVPIDAKTLTVEVVALDWKWLFFYPDLGIATVNEMAAPVDTQIAFKITASSVMNSFFVPALAGQIYAMPAMETQLHAVINTPGTFDGFSANYSGDGFSDMHFAFRGMSQSDFDGWVQKVKAGGGELDRAAYTALAKPSSKEAVHTYAVIAPDLYNAILNQCVDRSKMCASDMMRVDAGGHGVPGGLDVVHVAGEGGRTTSYVAAICTSADVTGQGAAGVVGAGRALSAVRTTVLPKDMVAGETRGATTGKVE